MNLTDSEKLLKKNSARNRKGTYLLVLRLFEDADIQVGKLGEIHFKKGIYFYVGSAKAGFSKRVIRYFSPIKRKRWHIDFLLEKAKPVGIFFMDSYFNEEKFAEKMSKLYSQPVKNFGSTDTKAYSHLFFKEQIRF